LQERILCSYALLAICLIAPGEVSAQGKDVSAVPGAVSWTYECKAGTHCPTNCSVGDNKELFASSDYRSLNITRIPGQTAWIKIDTGVSTIEFITQIDQLICRISNATLTSLTYGGAAKP
jgi:hypothetical protein